MADNIIGIEVENLKKVTDNMDKLAADLLPYMQGAGTEASNEILDNTVGLRKYPPATAANAPPLPYYIRGRGMQVSSTRNLGNSERLGTRWSVLPYEKTGVTIANPVSYAKWVHGAEQAAHMAKIGWRKLYEAAVEKLPKITEIYNTWVDKLIKKHDL